MHESQHSDYPGLIFRDSFNNEQATRKLGATINGIVKFVNGSIVLDQNTQSVMYPTIDLGLNYTMRFVADFSLLAAGGMLSETHVLYWGHSLKYIKIYSDNGANAFLVYDLSLIKKELTISVENGTTVRLYGDGVFLVSGTLSPTGKKSYFKGLGSDTTSGVSRPNVSVAEIEFARRVLSDSEIENLYNNTWNKELNVSDVLINFDARQGALDCGDLTDSLNINEVATVPDGNGYIANFTENSWIEFDADYIGADAITAMMWIKPIVAPVFVLLSNSMFSIIILGGIDVRIYNDSGTSVSLGTIQANSHNFIAFVRDTTGDVRAMVLTKKGTPTLADKGNAGTPTAAVVKNLMLATAGSGYYKGGVKTFKLVAGELTDNQIVQEFTSTLNTI